MYFSYKAITTSFLVGILLFATKGFSQREILPFEELFTYEYALKYYSNIGIMEVTPDYWFLENFMAPKGVKSIEEYPNSFSLIARKHSLPAHKTKTIHHYNLESGFVEHSQIVSEAPSYLDTLTLHYEYIFEENNIVINIEDKRNLSVSTRQFVFDSETKNLLLLVENKKDTTFFKYDLKNNTQVTETQSNSDSRTTNHRPYFEEIADQNNIQLHFKNTILSKKNDTVHLIGKNVHVPHTKSGSIHFNITDDMILFETNYQNEGSQYRSKNYTLGTFFNTHKQVTEFYIKQENLPSSSPTGLYFNEESITNLVKKKNKWKLQYIFPKRILFKLPRSYKQPTKNFILIKAFPYKVKEDGIYHKTKRGIRYKYHPIIRYNKS